MLARRDQAPVVEEFFELFKTPWEFYQPGQVYDVVITTVGLIPGTAPRLVISYGSATCSHEPPGIVTGQHFTNGIARSESGLPVPIYTGLLTFDAGTGATASVDSDVGVVGLRIGTPGASVIRIGYDLFDETRFLLSNGQPTANAHNPSLDVHIAMLRDWIVRAGVPLLEIPPSPAGYPFAVCLTHDIDFVGIRRHKLDHTMWGFLYRSTVGALLKAVRGRITGRQLVRTWKAVCSLPLVYLGWADDFWEPFAWYLSAERGLPATYYLIPFKKRAGDHVSGPGAARRATAYDVGDVRESAARLMAEGCEVGVHGLDAWHDARKGRSELERVSAMTGTDPTGMGIRMHWLLRKADTASILEQSGYLYDSTVGYNETIGYRAGTGQVFQPTGSARLLELPMHIQDGALFYPQRLDLTEADAQRRCADLTANASRFGGVLTVLWHDRSHAPERLWGEFYMKLIAALKSTGAWFGTARQIVIWFSRRRAVRFERQSTSDAMVTTLKCEGAPIAPPLRIRVYNVPVASGAAFSELHWDGKADFEWRTAFQRMAAVSGL